MLLAAIGTASPPMAAGAMLLFKFSIALSIGLAPLFILCLMFEQTKDLFRRWLLYTIGILFTLSTLSVVTGWVMELMAKIAVALWVDKMTGIFGNATEGLTTQAMMQGGIGLLMTVLIVTIPPIAASYFQGTLGNFMSYSAFAAKEPGKDLNTSNPPQPSGSLQEGGRHQARTSDATHAGVNRSPDQANRRQLDEIRDVRRDRD